MIQTTLFDDPKLLVRSRDPQTSKVAAVKATEFRPSHEGRIWSALEAVGARGITQNEVPGLSPVQANRRFAGMSDRKLIRRNGIERGSCCVWIKS